MKQLRAFDTHATALVAKLPKSLHQPFVVLGDLTTPLLWAGYFLCYTVLTYSSGIALDLVVFALLPLASISKFLFRRQRPPTIYAGNMRIKSYSFPSSHAYAAALMSGFFAYQCFTHNLEIIGGLFCAFGLIIGVSRVYVGAHYPSDVVAGWIFGVAAIATAIMIV